MKAHDTLERTFEDRQAPVGLETDEKDLRRLVSGKDEAPADTREPRREVRRRFLKRKKRPVWTELIFSANCGIALIGPIT